MIYHCLFQRLWMTFFLWDMGLYYLKGTEQHSANWDHLMSGLIKWIYYLLISGEQMSSFICLQLAYLWGIQQDFVFYASILALISVLWACSQLWLQKSTTNHVQLQQEKCWTQWYFKSCRMSKNTLFPG